MPTERLTLQDILRARTEARIAAEQPRFGDRAFPRDDMPSFDRWLGHATFEGTEYDLWLSQIPPREYIESLSHRTGWVATITARYGAGYYECVHERAQFWSTIGEFPGLSNWRPGANLALERADALIRILQLPLQRASPFSGLISSRG